MRQLIVIGAIVSIFTATAVRADVAVTDLQVAARVLSFMESPPRGTVRVGIVFSPEVRSTVRQAREVEALLRGGLQVGNIRLEPVVVSVADAASTDLDVVLLTENMAAHGDAVQHIARSRQIPCITTDIDRVHEGSCALGIRSNPRIEILVNRSLAMESGTAFATAFRMMITEI